MIDDARPSSDSSGSLPPVVRRRGSIRGRLIAIITSVSFLAIVVAGILLVGFQYLEFRKALIVDLNVQAEMLAEACSKALATHDLQAVQASLSMLRADPSLEAAWVLDRDQRVVGSFQRTGLPSAQPPASPGESAAGRLAYTAYRPVRSGSQTVGEVCLLTDQSELKGFLRRSLGVLALVLAGSTILALVLANRAQRLVSTPILQLARVARQISQTKDFSMRPAAVDQDELGQLSDAFGFMLAKVQRREAALKRSEERLRNEAFRLEERVAERTAELESVNRELEAFSFSVSHDLRAPLRSIDGFSQALVEDLEGGRMDAARDDLKRIRSASQRMGRLIDVLLSLSRLTRRKLGIEEVDIGELARSVLAELAAQDPSRQVRCEVQENLAARADRELLRVVLQNLIGNAWKFTAQSESPQIEVAASDVDGERVFRVQDNGAGFDMEFEDRLFGAFQRLHAAEDFEGNGIGLATVRRIVHRHGGRVWAEGIVGGGATFFFTLESRRRDGSENDLVG